MNTSEQKEAVSMTDLDDRAKRAGVSFAFLARRAGIHSWKLYGGYLNKDERDLVDAVLVEAERKRDRYRNAAYV
jgi:hypothetical protein